MCAHSIHILYDMKYIVIPCFQNRLASTIAIYRGKSIDCKNKLRTYRTFKIKFEQEQYLKNIKSLELRRCLSKFRTSCHDLEIETGRYKKLKLEERVCCSCNNKSVEDEVHFLIHCPKYQQKRKICYQFLSQKCMNLFGLCQMRTKKFVTNWLYLYMNLLNHDNTHPRTK
jgi:hypothetical protein